VQGLESKPKYYQINKIIKYIIIKKAQNKEKHNKKRSHLIFCLNCIYKQKIMVMFIFIQKLYINISATWAQE
jgi:hypothetical protein